MKLIALVSGLFFVAGNAMAAVKTCQTAAEINAHVETSAPEEFCFHKVENPAVGMATGIGISADMQLAPNLEAAFLNTYKDFDGAQASCASLGAGWHAPASSKLDADPRANDNRNSLEAMGKYFHGVPTTHQYTFFWSSSTVSNRTRSAWGVNLAIGLAFTNSKGYSNNVVCVRP
jgi:hypothetical protein